MQTLVMPQRLLRFVLAGTSLVLALDGVFAQEPSLQPVGPRFFARLKDGGTKQTQFVRTPDSSDISLTGDLALAHVARLDRSARQLDQVESLPLKRISLINGDSFTASFVSLTNESCHVVDEGIAAQVPRHAIDSIGSLAGMSDVFCVVTDTKKPVWRSRPESLVVDDSRFERVLSLPSNSRAELSLEQPLTRCELKLWLRISQTDAEQARIDFVFAESAEPLTVWWKPRTDSSNAGSFIAWEGGQQIGVKHQVLKNDWLCIRMLLDDDLHLAINQSVLAALPSRNRQLKGIRVESTLIAPSGVHSPLLIGPCFVQQRTEGSKNRAPASQQDAVQFRNGDLLFGSFNAANCSLVSLNAKGRQRDLIWGEVQRVTFAALPSMNSLPSITGWLARIDLQLSHPESNSQSLDVLHGAISDVNERGLELQHPLVGPMKIDWDQIRRVTPAFRGTSYPIELRPRHVGNQLRDDFQRPEPDGPQLRFGFHLPSQPTGPCMLGLKLLDLEPAGPETLRASPTLKELREGNLATLVFLNGKSLGRLNDRISFWSTSSDAQQIRIPIDPKMLQVGMNAIELKQSPARRDATRFDDFELLSLTLDVEAP